MTVPRQNLPGSVWLLSRRCIEGKFFLRPDAWVAPMFAYLLAYACLRFGVRLLGTVVMSNHYHALLHDPEGRLSAMVEWMHPLVSKHVNIHRGRKGMVWDGNVKTNMVRCESSYDALRKLTYLLANPVAAGAVRQAADWPGLITLPDQLANAEPTVYERPREYFRANGPMPDTAALKLHRIPGFEHLNDEEYIALVKENLAAAEGRIAEELAAEGRTFAGRDAVLAVPWTWAPEPSLERNELHPHIAAKDPATRIRALRGRKQFRKDYAESLAAWRAGDRDVVFPAGTIKFYFLHRAERRPPPDDVWRPLAEAA